MTIAPMWFSRAMPFSPNNKSIFLMPTATPTMNCTILAVDDDPDVLD